MLKWRPGEGAIWLTPGAPMIGAVVNELQQQCRAIASENGLDYMASFVCGPRFARGVHAIIFDRTDPAETRAPTPVIARWQRPSVIAGYSSAARLRPISPFIMRSGRSTLSQPAPPLKRRSIRTGSLRLVATGSIRQEDIARCVWLEYG